MATIDPGHRFGGAWTELKLDAVKYYLEFFTKVLANKPSPRTPFELWYVDAFAGSGSRQVDQQVGGILENRPIEDTTIDMAGSVLNALDIDPPFKRLVFIEGMLGRLTSLEAIRKERPNRNIRCEHGDANTKLKEIFGAPPWSNQLKGHGLHRAVVFLDPYGMSVDWETLQLLAATQAVDVWYLFPLEAVTRQLAGDLSRVDANKQRRLDAVLGTSNWRSDIYKIEERHDLFSQKIETASRSFTKNQIEQYAKAQLETLFRYVSDPLPLLNDRQRQIFSLFCLSNSESDAALGLIKKGVTSVLKKFGGAPHRMSGR